VWLHQVIQNIRNGKLSAVQVPDPLAKPGHVLIANAFSVISVGTERMAMELARKSLLGKAREQPDQVRRVLEKLRNEGFFNTIAQVREKLDEPMTMGYSSAGIVLACGAGVQEFKPGDQVASNGFHAGVVCVPKHLCARVPGGVPLEHAAFTVLGAIALQGVRLAKLELGDMAFLIGLGLIGQLTVAILKAQGCHVIGTDLDKSKCELALQMGADYAHPEMKAQHVMRLTQGLGADAVLITASTKSDKLVELAGETVRKKGRVIVIGAVGLNLPRRPYYFKEAEFVVSCSYGPGRYDPEYEEQGHDYPPAYVRWTEKRNMQAVLNLMASGRLDIRPLISHRFKIQNAEAAYQLIETEKEPYLGIILEYYDHLTLTKRLELQKRVPANSPDGLGIGCVGVGNFARTVLLPALKKVKNVRYRILCSAGGLSAMHSGEKLGFEVITSDENDVFKDAAVQAVFIATRHDQHAAQVIGAVSAGKHVFVEKPLCINEDQLYQIMGTYSAMRDSQSKMPLLMVGFNRRFSPAAKMVKDFFSIVNQPLTVSIRFNAGEIPPEHWTQDEFTSGGRIIGEACHAIDLATFLIGAPPVRVFAESIGGPDSPRVTDDQCFITLRHANGSISNIAYLAGGDKAYSKERVEVIGGGRIGVIDNFREVITSTEGKMRKIRLGGQYKGYQAEVEAFVRVLVSGGDEPITWDELLAVTKASILAVRSLREGIPFEISQ
jgi:predicted dehydrogenase/threonine dehydrogenase-like Zn-dependent dehydrogenase